METDKRSLLLRWGNIILLILMFAFSVLIISTTDPVTKQATLTSFFGTIAFGLAVFATLVLSVIRIFKKYHRGRSWIWLFITPILALGLIMSFIPR